MEKKFTKTLFFRLFNRTAKSPFFFTVSFMVIFFMIYADSIVSNVAMYPLDLTSYEIFELNGIQGTEEVLQPLLVDHNHTSESQLVSDDELQRKIEIEDNIDGDQMDDREIIAPPTNVTREERIEWFRRRLTETEILESNDLTKQFHARVLEFLNNDCDIQLHMTWFSPSKGFGPRQVMSIETLFKAHPKGCLIILSRTLDSKRGYRALKPILDLGFKVLAITPDVSFLLKNTPAESWLERMRNGDSDPGNVPFTQNLSNLLRIAVLYKYGGAYIDMDYVVMRDFYDLRNAIGAQSVDSKTKNWTRLNNAAMIFDMNHPILFDFMEDFSWNFNGNKWGFNGPLLVSRVVERVGEDDPGYNITVLPPKAFSPVNWVDIHKLLKKPLNETESSWVESMVNRLGNGETYGVHLWNNKIRGIEIEQGSVLEKLFSDRCVICNTIYPI